MKKAKLKIETIWDILNHRCKDYYRFFFNKQEVQVYIGDVNECLKKIFKINNNYLISYGCVYTFDDAKTIRNKEDIKLIIIPTICTNDSFFTNRYKETGTGESKKGKMPDYVIIDTDMIEKTMTKDMIYAGWGEFLSMMASYNDWRDVNKNKISKKDLKLLDKIIDILFRDARKTFDIDMEESVPIVMSFLFFKCLLMMAYDDNTIGASSDHMFAYGLDKLKLCQNKRHGINVFFSALISSRCYYEGELP